MSIKVVNPIIVENKLPRVTDEDNGKTLVVEQGEWTASENAGGGAKSWNDLEDRPFYEEHVSIGDTLTWDGTPSDTIINIFATAEGTLDLHHISDNTPSIEELSGGAVVRCGYLEGTSTTFEITADAIQGSSSDVVFISEPVAPGELSLPDIAIVYTDGAASGDTVIRRKGIYFARGENAGGAGGYIQSLKAVTPCFTKSTIHKIDPKFLPEGVGYTTNDVVQVLDQTITISGGEFDVAGILIEEQGVEYIISIDDVEYRTISKHMEEEGISVYYVGNSAVFGGADTGEPFLIASADVYGMTMFALFTGEGESVPDGEYHIIIHKNGEVVHYIDNKYIKEGLFERSTPNQVLLSKTAPVTNSSETEQDLEEFFTTHVRVGKQYNITWNGKQYVCQSKQLAAIGNLSCTYIGNASIGFNGADSGEPFILYYFPTPLLWWSGAHCRTSEEIEEYTLKIVGDYIEYAQIPKYSLTNALAYYISTDFSDPCTTLDGIGLIKAKFAIEDGRKVYGTYNGKRVEVVSVYKWGQDFPKYDAFSLQTLDKSTIYDWNYDPETGTTNDVSVTTGKYTVRKVGNKSWEDIENRPFGDEVILLGNTLTWDGNINENDVTFANLQYGDYCKVSDCIPTLEDVHLGGELLINNVGTYSISSENIGSHENYIDIQSKAIIIALADGISFNGTTIPEKGIYFHYSSSYYVSSLTLNGFTFEETEIHKIDEKYLPEGSGTKIIDLTQYTADDGLTSFNSALLLLFMAGGGSMDISDETTFWEDVNTTKPIKLKIDASALVSGATIYSDATAMVCDEIGATFFSTTYAMYEPNSQAHIRTTVMFERYTNKIRISLVLEPLTIPNKTTE